MRLHLDDHSKCWTHSNGHDVRTLLEHPGLGVRPADGLVPPALADTMIGELWSRWARMNDGPRHATLRARIDALLDPWDDIAVTDATERMTERLLATHPPRGASLDRLLEALPVSVLAELLGFRPQLHPELVTRVRSLVRATAPDASPETIVEADVSTRQLSALVEAQLHPDDADQTASIVALWWQSFDSMVGLLGNAVLALLRQPEAESTPSEASLASTPPILLTRRYALRPLALEDAELMPGACVRVDLHAAMAFGAGPHRCPGERLARQICDVAAPRIVAARTDWPRLEPRYRRSHNARIPCFADMEPR